MENMYCGNKTKKQYFLDDWRKRWIEEINLCVILSNREDDSGVKHKKYRIVSPLIWYVFSWAIFIEFVSHYLNILLYS